MQTTNISWATYSWNPVTGCSRHGPECTNCYAETFSRRQGRTDEPWTRENASENVTLHADRLEEPFEYHWPEGPGRVFVGSMTDLFHREIPESYIRRVVAIAAQFPETIWIFLTKRPERAAEISVDWPPNAWVGTSVGSGAAGPYPDTTHRLDDLRAVPAHTRWVSFEPLLGPIDDPDLSGIDWAVVGGETAPRADRREMDARWAWALKESCDEQAVAFYFKQHSGRYPEQDRELVDPETLTARRYEAYPDLPEVTVVARRDQGLAEPEVIA